MVREQFSGRMLVWAASRQALMRSRLLLGLYTST